MKVIVIGGGASGIMAAIAAGKNNHEVILLEKNEKLGKKIYITGKGRCNVTNNSDEENIINNTIANPYFLYSAIYTFNSKDTMDLLENSGIPLKTERGNRVFPVSDKSSDIILGLLRTLKKYKVKIEFNTEVKGILVEGKKAIGVLLTNGNRIYGDKIICGTGGLSYKSTGSTGDGYKFARDTGHMVTKLYPALVPIITNDEDIYRLQGLSLRNISLKAFVSGKLVYEDFGEVVFTHYGISGPLILTASCYFVDKHNKKISISIDLKPALSEKELDNRILRDFEENKNKSFKNSLNKLLPQKIIPIIIRDSKIDGDKQVNEITRQERKNLVNIIKGFSIDITGNTGYRDAVITAGGVCVDDINPSTMESKKIENLYFVGEVLDIHCLTGGYNLQVAFSTGYLAGNSI